jgi:hypothetical protein
MNEFRRWCHDVVLEHTQTPSSRFTGETIDDDRSPYVHHVIEEGWDCSCGEWFPL